jgi:FMN-dependent NADH-azoreductase
MSENMSKNILVVHSSPRGGQSVSRKLTAGVVAKLQAKYEGSTVVERDLAAAPLPHLSEEILGAFFTPADQHTPALKTAIAPSDAAIDELMAADVVVIGAPMWNFNIPSVLKAWIDHVARAGKTFKYSEEGPEGLLKGKKAIITLARGGVYSDGAMKAMDFQESYLRGVLGFLGITDVDTVVAEGIAYGEEAVQKAFAAAEAQSTTVVGKGAQDLKNP